PEGLGRFPGRQAEKQAVAHPAPRPDEMRALEVGQADEHARPEREHAHRSVGLLAKDAAHREVALADLETIPHAEAEPHQQRLVDEGPPATDERCEGSRGLRDEMAIEWIASSHRLELDDLALASRRRHGHELADGHALRAGTAQDGRDALTLGGERLGASDLDVASHEGPGGAPHRALEARREAPYRNEGSHS